MPRGMTHEFIDVIFVVPLFEHKFVFKIKLFNRNVT